MGVAGVLGELDLTPGGLLRSGSYIVLLALAFLLWSRRSAHPWNRRLAVAYACSAIGACVFNLVGANTVGLDGVSRSLAIPVAVTTGLSSLAAGVMLWQIVRDFLGSGRQRVLGLALTVGILLLGLADAIVLVMERYWFEFEPLVYRVGLLLPVAVGLVLSAEGAKQNPARSALFWAAMLPYWGEAMLYGGEMIHYVGEGVTRYDVIVFVAAMGTRLLATLWGLRAVGVSRTILVLVLAVLGIATLASLLGVERSATLGVSGILLVSANVATLFLLRRGGAFGPLGQSSLRLSRGTVASLGLAVLFITAQVAQNFFSAEIGLYSGGIIAGVVVFAAYPLQKAVERVIDRKPSPSGPAAFYRQQVETAWRDGQLGANERVMLRDLRLHLGISAEEADAVDHDVAVRQLARPRPTSN